MSARSLRALIATLSILQHNANAQETPAFKATARLVLVPVHVSDKTGKSVDGLTAMDFELYDQGVLRKFEVESTFAPISLVVAVQSSAISGAAIAKIQKIGSLIQPLIAGERGEAAVVTYSDRITLRQDFTSNAGRITEAFRKIEPDGGGASMNDAVLQSVRLLAQRGAGSRRRVLIVIGESRDRSSTTTLADVLSKAQEANVIVYPVTYSAYLTAFTSRGAEQFESGKPVYSPDGASGGLLAIFSEIARAGSRNAHEAMANYTGGLKTSFVKLKGLEQVLQKAGEDLHSQYLLTFQAADQGADQGDAEPYHALRVKVRGCPDCKVRHRPGYWKSPAAE